jgi:hypothetical protein
MSKVFLINGEIWRWPGDGGWHFLTINKKTSEKIRSVGSPYGAGFIKIKASIQKSNWETALFPNSKEKTYMISIKKKVREQENLFEGDVIKVKIEII